MTAPNGSRFHSFYSITTIIFLKDKRLCQMLSQDIKKKRETSEKRESSSRRREKKTFAALYYYKCGVVIKCRDSLYIVRPFQVACAKVGRRVTLILVYLGNVKLKILSALLLSLHEQSLNQSSHRIQK